MACGDLGFVTSYMGPSRSKSGGTSGHEVLQRLRGALPTGTIGNAQVVAADVFRLDEVQDQ